MNHPLAFVLVVEAGDLERKAVLLVESIRQFTGPFRDCPVWVIQPRAGQPLSQAALKAFLRNDAFFVSAPLNKTWQDFGYANKVYAAAFVESLVADHVETLVFLGSDMIFLQPPEQLLLRGSEVVAVRPVDGIATLALLSDQPLTDYWKLHFEIAGVDPSQLWNVETTVSGHRIRAYFQGDMLAVSPPRRIFQYWRDNLERLAADERVKRFLPGSAEYCNLEQVLFAATVLAKASRHEVKILDWHYNYPLPWHDKLPIDRRAAFLDDVVAVHYHRDFDDLAWTKRIGVREPIKSWLSPRLPLKQPSAPQEPSCVS